MDVVVKSMNSRRESGRLSGREKRGRQDALADVIDMGTWPAASMFVIPCF